ncbi:hypothetical protein LAZ67_20000830 [Cordylochernes scorpioides]|uniref:Uncharacterized protein n=1 Tax=Cordylochernes scorpioides TaxID=51811 RepID=A0ABY6LKG0_9ARAC|nr:hypothetical protein LAZ67_20000830 [Cordylochernes scorpioides]
MPINGSTAPHQFVRLLHLENPKIAWTKLVTHVTTVYNNTPHSVTRFPPIYLMFGTLPPELTEHLTLYPELDAARRIAHELTQTKHLRDKRKFDKQHKAPHFEPGDLVLVKIYQHPNTGKLSPYFTGPYEIIEIVSPNVVRINRPNLPLNLKTDTVHVNKLQYYNQNIRYIAPPTVANTRSAPGSATLNPFRHLTPDLFKHSERHLEANTSQPFRHLTPDLFTATRFAPGLETITTSIPSKHQCNVASPRNVPQHVPPIQTLRKSRGVSSLASYVLCLSASIPLTNLSCVLTPVITTTNSPQSNPKLQVDSTLAVTNNTGVDIEVRLASGNTGPRGSKISQTPPYRRVDRIVDAKGREEDSKEPMKTDPDYESGENPTFSKKENTLGKTQEIAPGQEDVTPPPLVSDVLGRLTTTLHQLSAVTGHRERWNRYDGSYEAQSFFTNYDAQADRAQLQYSTRLRKPPNLLQAPLRVTHTRAYVTCSPDHL